MIIDWRPLLFASNFLIVYAHILEPHLPIGGPCENIRPGDCNPEACTGEESACEARYTRFWDPVQKLDRTRKSCQCVPINSCSIIGMSQLSGCKSYMSLSSVAQKQIREWTMSPSEKVMRKQAPSQLNTSRSIFSDRLRHFQLQNGNTRFCCKTSKKKRRYVPTPIHIQNQNSANQFVSVGPLLVSVLLFF